MAEKAKKVTPIIIEGFEINAQNVTFQKLQEFSVTLFEKLLNHRKERNFLLIERDKLRSVLENTRHEINVARDITLNKEKELETTQEVHSKEIKEVEQEVKFILYNHGLNLAELKVWEKSVLSKQGQMHLEEEIELLREKRGWKEKFDAGKIKCQEELENLKIRHLEESNDLQKECDEAQILQEIEFQRNFNHNIQHLTLKHEMEMSEVEERKNSHLMELISIHNTRTEETKKFFNAATAENLAIISSLKQCLDNVKSNKSVMAAEVKKLKEENKKLIEPLEKSKYEVKNLKRQLINYEKDLRSLKNNKRMLQKSISKTADVNKKSQEVITKIKSYVGGSFMQNLDSSCLNSVSDLENESKQKVQKLKEIIDVQIEDLAKKQKMLQNISSDPDVAAAMKELNFEYWSPKELSMELAVITKAHDELLNCLEDKLDEFCISEGNLDFRSAKMKYSGTGSAALVAKN